MITAHGFMFLAVATGVGTFISFILACVAVSDNEDYAGFMVVMTIIFTLAFLVSGFYAFSLA